MAQEYAMPRQRIESVRTAIYTNILAELHGRFTEEGCEEFNSLCRVVCPDALVVASDDTIDAYDFLPYMRRFPSLRSVDTSTLKTELKILRDYLIDIGICEKGLLREEEPDIEGQPEGSVINDDGFEDSGGDEAEDLGDEDLDAEFRSGAHRDKNHYTHKCLPCTFHYILFKRANTGNSGLKNVFLIYHHILTMSVDVDECERVWSGLKYIKTRLRSQLTENHTRETLLCYTNSDILMEIPLDELVDNYGTRNDLMRSLLMSP